MEYNIFIDGEASTTGLQIRERLESRGDIRLIQIDPQRRKDADARRDAFAQADVAILCLPDEAAREAVRLAQGLDVRLIDASTAHRVDAGWIFGFPELAPGQRERIAAASRTPQCLSDGLAALTPGADPDEGEGDDVLMMRPSTSLPALDCSRQ